MAASWRAEILALVLLLAGAGVPAALAGPAEYVVPTVVEEGERELDFKAGTARLRGGGHAEQQSFGFGASIGPRWLRVRGRFAGSGVCRASRTSSAESKGRCFQRPSLR